MRTFKTVMGFIIVFFLISMFNNMVALANFVSSGSKVVETGFYILVGLLVLRFFVYPLVRIFSIPSEKLFEKMHKGNSRAMSRIYRRCLKDPDFTGEKTRNPSDMQNQITEYYTKRANGFNKIVLDNAFAITTTVTVSPNSFIDGLAIILGNVRMVYRLMKHLGIRYSMKGLFSIYYNIFAVASVSGIMQEYSDEIEEFLIDMADAITKEGSRTIPILNVVFNAASPLLQASLNYAYIIYSGMRIKYRMLRTIQNNGDSEKTISTRARKEARRERMKYFQKTMKRVSERMKGPKGKAASGSDPIPEGV